MTPEKLRPAFTFTEDRLRQLQQVVPEAFADGKINWETLREVLGNYLEDEEACEEHFGLFWPGKRQARRLAALPPKGTLAPAPGEGVNEDQTHHLFIEGENLEVLKLLQKSYAGRVKMIYIDPPYNTGKDFIYPDDYSEPLEAYLKRTGQMDEEGRRLTTNTRASGRFHSNWLNMMYPRLLLARQLLQDDGVIVVHIDEHEFHNLIQIMNEIFGEENALGAIVWDKRNPKGDAKGVAYQHEYIVLFAKQKEKIAEKGGLKRPKENAEKILAMARKLVREYGEVNDEVRQKFKEWLKKQNFSGGEKAYNLIDESGEVYQSVSMAWPNKKKAPKEYFYPLIHPVTGKPCPVPERGWRNPPDTMQVLLKKGVIIFGPDETTQPRRKYLLKDNMFENVPSLLYYGGSDDAFFKQIGLQFDNPKPLYVSKKLVEAITCSDKSAIIMDFFAGSCTAAHAVLQQNREDGGKRQFIMVQLPEPTPPDSEARKAGFVTIAEIGKERIRRVIAKMQAEREGQMDFNPDEDLGFKVFKLRRSHFKEWQPVEPTTPQVLDDLFSQHTSPLVEGWGPQALLTEILLLEGFPLGSAIVSLDETFPGNTVWRVHHPDVSHELFVCLDETLAEDTVERLKAGDLLRAEDIFICLDAALTDEAKVVLDDRLRLKVI